MLGRRVGNAHVLSPSEIKVVEDVLTNGTKLMIAVRKAKLEYKSRDSRYRKLGEIIKSRRKEAEDRRGKTGKILLFGCQGEGLNWRSKFHWLYYYYD